MGMLMRHFLDENFRQEYIEWVISVQSEDYYVRMMQAWYMATALAKQWETTLPYIMQYRLHPWIHNRSIRKAIESYRISPEQKTLLKSFCLSSSKPGKSVADRKRTTE